MANVITENKLICDECKGDVYQCDLCTNYFEKDMQCFCYSEPNGDECHMCQECYNAQEEIAKEMVKPR